MKTVPTLLQCGTKKQYKLVRKINETLRFPRHTYEEELEFMQSQGGVCAYCISSFAQHHNSGSVFH